MAAGMLQFSWPWMQTTAWISAGVLALTALLVQTRSAGAQLLARGTWTSVLLLSTMNAFLGPSAERGVSAALVAAALVALGVTTGRSLADAERGPFLPRAFRFSLVAAMSLAFADAASLLFYGIAWLDARSLITLPLVLGVGMLGSLAGLYRLRGWGLLGAMSVALVTSVTAFAGSLAVPVPAQLLLAITASAQLVLLAPLLHRALRGTAPGAGAGLGASTALPRVRVADDVQLRVAGGASLASEEATWADADREAGASDEVREPVRPARVVPSS